MSADASSSGDGSGNANASITISNIRLEALMQDSRVIAA
jgi:hypothetical protein